MVGSYHISATGPWYNHRGHFENISNNLPLGATNAFLPDAHSLQNKGKALDQATGKSGQSRGARWCIMGDANYGGGSSREHVALEPRFLMCVAVIAPRVRAYSRDDPQEAGRAGADVCGPF
ncbi:putative aconitate hydratase [Diaporthe ampelina]|uniref:Aconitate hydratase, mitochondrial n=1 Tax=Diaporthe ampelina TaxID=1214573 RepID=A0A0G2FNY6_9PEZI|nr:putative aconitate hydratase [Diaporthe ampelina]